MTKIYGATIPHEVARDDYLQILSKLYGKKSNASNPSSAQSNKGVALKERDLKHIQPFTYEQFREFVSGKKIQEAFKSAETMTDQTYSKAVEFALKKKPSLALRLISHRAPMESEVLDREIQNISHSCPVLRSQLMEAMRKQNRLIAQSDRCLEAYLQTMSSLIIAAATIGAAYVLLK